MEKKWLWLFTLFFISHNINRLSEERALNLKSKTHGQVLILPLIEWPQASFHKILYIRLNTKWFTGLISFNLYNVRQIFLSYFINKLCKFPTSHCYTLWKPDFKLNFIWAQSTSSFPSVIFNLTECHFLVSTNEIKYLPEWVALRVKWANLKVLYRPQILT